MTQQQFRMLVLEKAWVSRRPVTYRGVNRYGPSYQRESAPDAPVNRAFRWLCQHTGTDGIVRDLSGARNLVNEYKRLSPPVYLEIIEPALEGTEPDLGREFLGWDLSVRGTGFSLVLWAIHEMEPGKRNKVLGIEIAFVKRNLVPSIRWLS